MPTPFGIGEQSLAVMNIRIAKPGDVQAIATLHASSWAQTYSNVLSRHYLEHVVPTERHAVWCERFANPRQNQFILVAEAAECIIGFACLFAAEHAEWGSYLDNLHVKQACRGQGVGKALLAEVALVCEKSAPGQGLYLSVNQANHNAQQFYLKRGACNVQTSVWNAPDGSQVPTFRFAWQSAASLIP